MNEKAINKKSPLLVVLCLLLCCSLALSCVTAVSTISAKREMHEISQLLGQSVDTGGEDDIVIADEYTIRSTTQISDAYLNGTEDQLSDRDKETLSMAKTVLKSILKKNMTDYEKEEACYLWLCKEMKSDDSILTVIHESAADTDNPYGVLKHHNAICVGYATTMRLFMQMLGIDCKVIHSSDLVHSWNLIKLDDEWYHVDCYSDADALYGNFNMNDDAASENHTWNRNFFPAATGIKYSYAAQHAVELKNIYAIPAWVKQMIDKGEPVGACKFKEKVTEKNEAEAAAMLRILTDGLQSVQQYSDKYFFDSAWSKDEEGNYILVFRASKYSNTDEEVDKKTREMIEKKISEAFGEAIQFYHEEDDPDLSNTETTVKSEMIATTEIIKG